MATRNFEQWVKDNLNEELPGNEIPGSWFAERNSPMVVECTACKMTMCVASARIDEDNQIFCADCADYADDDPNESDEPDIGLDYYGRNE
jgi:hypothetical protein